MPKSLVKIKIPTMTAADAALSEQVRRSVARVPSNIPTNIAVKTARQTQSEYDRAKRLEYEKAREERNQYRSVGTSQFPPDVVLEVDPILRTGKRRN
jgi:hypothetical protein